MYASWHASTADLLCPHVPVSVIKQVALLVSHERAGLVIGHYGVGPGQMRRRGGAMWPGVGRRSSQGLRRSSFCERFSLPANPPAPHSSGRAWLPRRASASVDRTEASSRPQAVAELPSEAKRSAPTPILWIWAKATAGPRALRNTRPPRERQVPSGRVATRVFVPTCETPGVRRACVNC